MTEILTLPVPPAVIDRAKSLATKVAGIVSRIGTLKIETTEEMDMASALLVEIANERRAVEKAKKDDRDPYNRLLNEISAQYEPVLTELKSGEETLDKAVLAYRAEQRRIGAPVDRQRVPAAERQRDMLAGSPAIKVFHRLGDPRRRPGHRTAVLHDRERRHPSLANFHGDQLHRHGFPPQHQGTRAAKLDARDALENGIIGHLNEPGRRGGLSVGMRLREMPNPGS